MGKWESYKSFFHASVFLINVLFPLPTGDMIHKIVEDDDGNIAIELDEEGIDYFVDGLLALAECSVGSLMVTPSVWTTPAPWWRFWDRSEDPVIGEFRLRKVA